MKDDIKLEIISGTGKESKKPYKALKITIGEWQKLVFVGSTNALLGSSFELKYIEDYLNEHSQE